MNGYTRREAMIMGAAGVALAQKPTRPPGVVIETHVHMFADDQSRFPVHRNSPYKPGVQPVEKYAEFVRQVRLDHTIIVHPEPYQDDHRYLEYCFEHEPSRGYFKGTCLFDPIAPETPGRMEALVKKHPGRIVALRVHEWRQDCKVPPTTTGPICDRDMRSPAMLTTWRKAHSLGLAIQMHFLPCYAGQIYALASQLKEMPVVLDHLGRVWMGTPMDYEEVLRLADLPRVFMKFSAVPSSSDMDPLVRRCFQAFGADRMLWGSLGATPEAFERSVARFEKLFAFASASDRAKIRGLNAVRLFNF